MYDILTEDKKLIEILLRDIYPVLPEKIAVIFNDPTPGNLMDLEEIRIRADKLSLELIQEPNRPKAVFAFCGRDSLSMRHSIALYQWVTRQ